ncbi:MAG: glycosyltransferase family 4 protein [Candidatus Binatus sp.]|uniref:glycosyltransferase family 4 protein n=1 Tax=Candidatus Binatus sp. TaxID=2811406 RepID=UPI003BB08638
MRVAVANWHSHVVGGAESYIRGVVTALESAGIEVAMLSERESAAGREKIELSAGAPTWCVSDIGEEAALAAMRAWRPDVVYVHLIESTTLEARLLELAPAVLFAHSYHGMCISGEKTFRFPDVRPCGLPFGWKCLLHFYPNRCGGLSPITMWQDYLKQSERHSMLPKYSAIATASEYLRRQLIANGAKPERVHKLAMPVSATFTQAGSQPVASRTDETKRIIFVGRMGLLKGTGILLDSMPAVAAALNSKINLTFVGDGPGRTAWEERARRLEAADARINIEMAGWKKPEEIRAVLAEADLLVVPSVWPETFGLVGPEAGRLGVPAAAFDVGGISEWLVDGVNGELAPGNPPTAQGLVDAIVRCIRDPAVHQRLRAGALEVSQRFDTRLHVQSLIKIFQQVAEPELRRESESLAAVS